MPVFGGPSSPLVETLPVQAFTRVSVDYLVYGQSRVTWDLGKHLKDPLPSTWQYALQYNPDGAHPTEGWQDVGMPVLNAVVLTDPTPRPWAKVRASAYRVRLLTPKATYYSPPALTLGSLGREDWLKAREITRKHNLLYRKKTSQSGYLLRRKREGQPCTKCLDPATGAVTLSKCTVCLGTRFLAGYWAAVPAVFCQVEPSETREHQDPERGMRQDDATWGLILAVPGLGSNDLWVAADSDLRYYVHEVRPAAQVRDVPVILRVGLRQLPQNDVAYTVGLEGN